ncbi:hypothetical protein N5V81_14225 [Escherichia coli]|nr:hypothetical protein [Escherichia coli]
MKNKLRPLDMIMAHPDTLKKIKVVNELDRGLLDTIQWGFLLFHPDEENNTRQLDVCDGVEVIGLLTKALMMSSTMLNRPPFRLCSQ